MKKTFRKFEPGTAGYVVHHGHYMVSRGKNPSQPFLHHTNPREALKSAATFMDAQTQRAMLGDIIALLGEEIVSAPDKPAYSQMQEPEIKAALMHIVSTSSSEAEVKERIKDELGCPYTPSTMVLSALSRAGQQARELCLSIGGLKLKTGDLIQVMLFGPTGDIIQV